MATYKFSENNSGGRWWLDEDQYKKLFEAGWTYKPSKYDIERGHDKNPWLGGTVPYGWRHDLTLEAESIEEAVKNFEKATGEDFFVEGCNCCGAPFSITNEETHEYMSGDSVPHEPIRPF